MITPVDRLPASVRALHWIGVAFVLIGYLTGDAMEDGGSGARWHVLAGLGLLLVFVPRIWLHVRHRRDFSAAQPGGANRFASFVHMLLLAFLLLQPLLGMLAVWAEGDALSIPFTSWAIPPPFAGMDREWPKELHELLGNAFYAVIALHTGAALWHHFRRHDPALRRML